MNIRKITSLTALISFVLLILTSVILYIVPSGRVAYWASWKLWGLSKEQWAEVHINLGVLLLIAMILHIYLNWKPMVSYMRSRTRKFRLFTVDFNVSLLIALVVFFGTLAGIPPMSSVIQLGANITEDANQFYGEPPYGHAELSVLPDFAQKVDVDLDEAIGRLEAAGYQIPARQMTIGDLAEVNGVAPGQLYAAMKPEMPGETKVMPEESPGGTGQKKLGTLCETYQLNVESIIAGLAEMGIVATSEQTLKEIGAAVGKDPHAIYALIYSISHQ